MLNRSTSRFTLLLLIALVAILPACKKKAPPAPAPPPPPPAVTTEPTPPPTTVEEPADVWIESTPVPQDFLTVDEINARRLLAPVFFDYDRAEIRADQRATLQANAAFLRENTDVRVLVEGNCDERGTRQYNLALGDRRARATRDYLVSLGIDGSRIETVSYGEERPVADGQNEQAWAQNRRSEFVAVASGQATP